MSDKKEQEVPFLTLGARLRRLRENVKESLDEVAGAVEIAARDLEDFEKGNRRPTEDILDLLISHFSIQESEAEKLWKLAGYELTPDLVSEMEAGSENPTIVVVPMDPRISYTDMVEVATNKEGVVINFMQSSGAGVAKPVVISRVGMSREAAEKLIEQLKGGFMQLEPKALPPSTSSSKSGNN